MILPSVEMADSSRYIYFCLHIVVYPSAKSSIILHLVSSSLKIQHIATFFITISILLSSYGLRIVCVWYRIFMTFLFVLYLNIKELWNWFIMLSSSLTCKLRFVYFDGNSARPTVGCIATHLSDLKPFLDGSIAPKILCRFSQCF